MSILYKKHNYLNKNISLIRDINIREYDIKSAGLNILHNLKVFTDEEYNNLLNMEKYNRNYLIGKFLQANPKYNTVMMDEFINIRKKFFELNNLEDDDVLSIKKDSIVTLDKECDNLIFDNYEFISKEEYNIYLQFNKKEFYYNKYTKELNVKGYSKETKEFQKNYYFKLLTNLFDNIKDKDEIFRILVNFKNDLLFYNLPIEYYKDIDFNLYLLKMNNYEMGAIPYLPSDSNKKLLFINNNVSFINTLCSKLL